VAKGLYDCHVTAVCSGANVDFVKGLGADKVIDYTKADLLTELLSNTTEKYDLFIDCVGGTDIFPKMVRLHMPHL
jgi:NADPH:quinone reductase-like Zn-dependent oxidoreductase